jgi:hypothetical protein
LIVTSSSIWPPVLAGKKVNLNENRYQQVYQLQMAFASHKTGAHKKARY